MCTSLSIFNQVIKRNLQRWSTLFVLFTDNILSTRHLSQRISLNKYYIINITIYKLSTFDINIYLK